MKSKRVTAIFVVVFLWVLAASLSLRAQEQVSEAKRPSVDDDLRVETKRPTVDDDLRVETVPVAGGAEIVTIFARHSSKAFGESREMPLLSVLRDTLGDQKKENDKLRYVWMLTYTEPSLKQKAAAVVPFLYTRTTNKKDVGDGPPPKLVDLNNTNGGMWAKISWQVFRKIILS